MKGGGSGSSGGGGSGRVQVHIWRSILGLVDYVKRMWRDAAVTERQRAMQGLVCVSLSSPFPVE